MRKEPSLNGVVLKRFLRGLGAVVLAFLAAWVVSDDALGLVPDQYDALVIAIVAPSLLALEKWLRDGGDATS